MAKTKSESADQPKSDKKKRSYLSQSDVPGLGLEQALRVPRAIAENYAGKPVTPLKLASALNMTPSSGPFRTLCSGQLIPDSILRFSSAATGEMPSLNA